MYNIENNTLKITIAAKGAELKSVVHKQHQLEYMWQADPAFWAKTSPVLFPIVGELKNKQFRYRCQLYRLPRHGFAREKEFAVSNHQTDTIRFTLDSNDETFSVYPFRFSFSLVYTLHEDSLTVTYLVENRGEEDMLFSVGGHPAFRVPLVAGTAYNDYSLQFEKRETSGRWPISKDGMIEAAPQPMLQNSLVLPLTKDLFAKDAIVLKNLQSETVRLQSDKTPHGLHFSIAGFPYLGLWAAPGADFICIEPWCGIADSVKADGELEHKEGINRLAPGERFSRAWKVRFF